MNQTVVEKYFSFLFPLPESVPYPRFCFPPVVVRKAYLPDHHKNRSISKREVFDKIWDESET
ncbi:hypothetical protein MUO66_09115, partial [Candidatus Bathyarchaeota archaeon]|nr:hypothetical protein [Candidatus Bathyarchaeota archaeon]